MFIIDNNLNSYFLYLNYKYLNNVVKIYVIGSLTNFFYKMYYNYIIWYNTRLYSLKEYDNLVHLSNLIHVNLLILMI